MSTTMNQMSTILVNAVNTAYANMDKNKDLWADSPWKHINDLENDFVGRLGERFIQNLCDTSGINASIDGLKTKEIGGGAGDGTINGSSIEIKCARQGTSTASFQHELGECPWKADYMVFIDIAPHQFFISVFPNWTEEQYKEKGRKWAPYFPSKSCTWRKGTGAFKFDTTFKINEKQSKEPNAYTFEWSPKTSLDEFKTFVNRIIPVIPKIPITEIDELPLALGNLTIA